jgi:DsbC/DsbD-like thiol-disulfide interchange protein
MRLSLCTWVLLGLSLAATPVGAAEEKAEGDLVKATLLADVDAIVPGGTFTLGVKLTMKPHWHTYWINPGESGQATTVKLKAPPGLEFGSVQWPLPTRIEIDGGVTFGYEDEVLLMVPVTVKANFPVPLIANPTMTIHAEVAWLVCKETCIEGDAKLSLTLPIRGQAKPANEKLFNTWRGRLPQPADQVALSDVQCRVKQLTGGNGEPLPALDIYWGQAPAKVEFFPVATRDVAIDDVKIKHDDAGSKTSITFSPQVFDADALAKVNGKVDGVLVFTNAQGVRQGVSFSFIVPAK